MLRNIWFYTCLTLIGFFAGSLATAALSYYGMSDAEDWIVPMGIIGGGGAAYLYSRLIRKHGW